MKAATTKKIKIKTNDLPDSENDKKHLQSDDVEFELPDIKDIPGQEHIRPMPPGEMADTTISSADEEADDLLDTDEDKIMAHSNSDVTKEEKKLLQQSTESMATADDQELDNAQLDSKDDDGTPLNEKNKRSGNDLDIPGSEETDTDEDEENNSYSLSGEKED